MKHGHAVFGQGERQQEILAQNLAGMDGSVRSHGSDSVVIDDFLLELGTGFPAEKIVRSSSFSLIPQGGAEETKIHAKARTPDRLPRG